MIFLTETIGVIKAVPEEDDSDDDEVSSLSVITLDDVMVRCNKADLRIIDRTFPVGDVLIDRRHPPSSGGLHGRVVHLRQMLLVRWTQSDDRMAVLHSSSLSTVVPFVASAWVLSEQYGLGKDISDERVVEHSQLGLVVRFPDTAVVYVPYASWGRVLGDEVQHMVCPGMQFSAPAQAWAQSHWLRGAFSRRRHRSAEIVAVVGNNIAVSWWAQAAEILQPGATRSQPGAGGASSDAAAGAAAAPAPAEAFPSDAATPAKEASGAAMGGNAALIDSPPEELLARVGSHVPVSITQVSQVQSAILNNSLYWTPEFNGIYTGQLPEDTEQAGQELPVPDLAARSVKVILTLTLHDILWEDGSVSTQLPGKYLGENDGMSTALFLPGEAVTASAGSPLAAKKVSVPGGGSLKRRHGVVLCADPKQGTVRVRWLPQNAFKQQSIPAPAHLVQYSDCQAQYAQARVRYMRLLQATHQALAAAGFPTVPTGPAALPHAASVQDGAAELGVEPEVEPVDAPASPAADGLAGRFADPAGAGYNLWWQRGAPQEAQHQQTASSAWASAQGKEADAAGASLVQFAPSDVPAAWGEQVGRVEDVPVFDVEDHEEVTLWSRDFVVRAPGHDVGEGAGAAAGFDRFDVVLQGAIAGRVGEVLCTDLASGRIAVRWMDGRVLLEDPSGLLKLDEDDFESVQVRVSGKEARQGGASAHARSTSSQESEGGGDSSEEEGSDEEGSEGGSGEEGSDEASEASTELEGDLQTIDSQDSDLMTLDSAAENMVYAASTQYSAKLEHYVATLQGLRSGVGSGAQLQACAPLVTPSMLRDAQRLLLGAATRGGQQWYQPVQPLASDQAIMQHWAGALIGANAGAEAPSPDSDEEAEDAAAAVKPKAVKPVPPSPQQMGEVSQPVNSSVMAVWRQVAKAAGLLDDGQGDPSASGLLINVPIAAPSDFTVQHTEEESVPIAQALKDLPKPQRKWLQAIRRQFVQLSKGLPQGTAAVSFEGTSMACRLVIMGPPGTPFAYVPWVFDVFMGADFPQEPPQLHYHSYVGQKMGPNLYPEGKVCLSLLGTWHAQEESEGWDPQASTLLQLVVSLQGIILTELPFFMEAGYDRLQGTADGEIKARQYNEMAVVLALRSFTGLVQRPPTALEALIRTHAKAVIPRMQALYAAVLHDDEVHSGGAAVHAAPPPPAPGAAAGAGGGSAAVPSIDTPQSYGVTMDGVQQEALYMRSILPARLSAAFKRAVQVALKGLETAAAAC